MNEQTAPAAEEANGPGLIDAFVDVLLHPTAFFSSMPRAGGYAQPLIFMVGAGLLAGLIRALLAVFGLGGVGSFAMAIAGIVIAPILIALFGFVGAAILFAVWKLMGSKEDYETAYRCTAYASAISPPTQLLIAIPYLGILLSLAWWTVILVVASHRVHGIRQGTAVTVFGILAALTAVGGISAEVAARHLESSLDQARSTLQNAQNNPDDAAKAASELNQLLQHMDQGNRPQTTNGQ